MAKGELVGVPVLVTAAAEGGFLHLCYLFIVVKVQLNSHSSIYKINTDL